MTSSQVTHGEASPDRSVKIRTFLGQTVILPCQIKVSDDEDVPSVEWSKKGLTPNITFLYRQGCETFEEKNPDFHYRTNLFMKELKNGNMSLRLSDVRLSDAGTYKCKRIQKVSQDASTIELSVGAASEPKLSVVRGDGVTLQCEASCWFPLPDITFLDAQGEVIGAEDPKNDRSTSGCFNVTRRATVHSGNWVTCRVHQPEINQTRVTEIYIPDDCMVSCTLTAVLASVAVLSTIIVIAIIAFLWWKYCNSEGGHKSLPNQSSPQSSTRSNAERQNEGNQADSPTEHQRKVDPKDEIIRRLTGELEDLRSQQSPVVGQLIDLAQHQFPHDTNPKPAASTNSIGPKSGNFPQNKDSKPVVSIQIPASGPQIQRSGHSNSSPDLLMNSGAAWPIAASPAFLAEGTHVGRSMSVSEPRPRSNGAKAPRRSTISLPSSNRYNVLADLPEDEAEPYMRRE